MPEPDSERELLAVANAAASAAAGELRAWFGEDLGRVRSKSTPTDPVSAADLAAEAAIRAVLARERPADAILGEEGGATDAAATGGSGGLRWVVDPLDGTVNFIYGIPTFAVSVACEDANGGLVAVVLDPNLDERFEATRSGPPTLNGQQIHPSGCDDLARALVGTGFAYDAAVRARQAAVAASVVGRVRDIRRAGAASLDLCSCACGRLDAYYERGVRPWDCAAGALICARAGLDVRWLAARDGLPDGIVIAPPALIDEFYALVSPVD